MKASKVGLPKELDELGLDWEDEGRSVVRARYPTNATIPLWVVSVWRDIFGKWAMDIRPDRRASLSPFYISRMHRMASAICQSLEIPYDEA